MSRAAPTSSHAFEARYARDADPWQFATSDYERDRYRLTLEALRRPYYSCAFEPGCSIGELTARLAARSARVWASDFAPSAVARAIKRCSGLPNVEISCADLTRTMPPGAFDLIVFSEIGYYFDEAALGKIAGDLADRMSAGGEFVAVHWLGASSDHVLHGDRVHEVLQTALPLTHLAGSRHTGFRIDSWSKE